MSETCCVCTHEQTEKMFAKDGIPYYQCRSCRFIFSRQKDNANFQNAFEDYEPAYVEYLNDAREDEKNFQVLLRWMNTFNDLKGKRVLDVGCGSGKLVRYLRRMGVDAYGLEPSDVLCQQFLKGDEYFSHGSLKEYMADDVNAFDVVITCDVIEHVQDPETFIHSICHLLKPDGYVFLYTPDVGSVLARISGRHWHFFNKYHFSFLSRATLKILTKRYRLHEIGFARLPRYKSVGYILQYGLDFVLRLKGSRIPNRWYQWTIPFNTFDTMYVAFQKTGGDA